MRRRMPRSCDDDIAVTSAPLKVILPEVGSTSRISDLPSEDLPQPDSPTSATVSPASISSETSSTARTVPRPPV
ncbi:hypothetical protein D3C87_1392350 [compost metagenome]